VILLRRRFLEMGRPTSGLVCPPLTRWASSGLLNTGWLAKRAQEAWDNAQLRRITLQEARHTAGTWLDAAGVSPKVASVLMGHAVPERQPGAATITLAQRRGDSTVPGDRLRAQRPDHVWAFDFQFDVTDDGRAVKLLYVVDEFTREALAMEAERRIDGDKVVDVLDRLVRQRGRHPEFVRCDNRR
jgi:integrase-like protein